MRDCRRIRSARRAARAGFTLVEVLAAVVLLSIGLLAVLAASQAARDTQTRTVYISIGRNIAQSRIEALRSMRFDSLAAQTGVTQNPSLPPGNSVETIVEGYPASSETNLRRVTVRVSWREKNGTRTIRYETLIARK
ncbi:MAG: type IV pilus modification PilV family protein [Armatimonadota bacterium]